MVHSRKLSARLAIFFRAKCRAVDLSFCISWAVRQRMHLASVNEDMTKHVEAMIIHLT